MIPINTHPSAHRSNFWIPSNRFFLPSSLAWARGPECWYHIVSSSAVILGQETQPYSKYLLGFWNIGPEYFLSSLLTQSFLKYLQEEGSNMSRAVHHSIAKPPIAELSIASCPSQHRQAVHRSIAKPFFASCPSRAVHRCIVKLASSITSCPSLYRRAVQRFIAEPSIAKPSIAEPSIFCRCPSPPNAEALSIIHQSWIHYQIICYPSHFEIKHWPQRSLTD